MSSSLLLKESFDNLDQFNESFKLLLKNQNLKFKRKILSEKSKLLKKICEDKDLDFNVEFDRYIGDKLGYTQGIGLSYQVDFQTLRSLLSKIITNSN